MSHCSDRTHAQFLLFDVFGVDQAYGVEPYEDFDPETAAEILERVGRSRTTSWPTPSRRPTCTRSDSTRCATR